MNSRMKRYIYRVPDLVKEELPMPDKNRPLIRPTYTNRPQAASQQPLPPGGQVASEAVPKKAPDPLVSQWGIGVWNSIKRPTFLDHKGQWWIAGTGGAANLDPIIGKAASKPDSWRPL